MTVVLTGDVHQWIASADRAHSTETESALAVDYARIASRHGLKVTLFFTGRAIREDPKSVASLLREENVEFGGHGWDAFRPEWRYRLVTKVFGSPHGPRRLQQITVRRTCATIEEMTETAVSTWRNHAYWFDTHTPEVLAAAGIRVWSDEVQLDRTGPYVTDRNLVVLPINTTPDHEHVYHGDQQPAAVAGHRRDQYDHPDAWGTRVARQVESIVERRGVATILAHPLCMNVADEWRTFESLCQSLSGYRTAWASEAAAGDQTSSSTDSGEPSQTRLP